MELLKEVAPQTSRVALMFNPATSLLKPVEAAAPLLKMAVVAAPVHNPAEIEPIMVPLARELNTGLFRRAAPYIDRILKGELLP